MTTARFALQLRLGTNWNKQHAKVVSLNGGGPVRRPTMIKFDSVEISERAHFAENAPIVVSQHDARQGPTRHRMLYVLGFGLAGAIFANGLVFIYFVWLYASG
jgi:hypothetical protein